MEIGGMRKGVVRPLLGKIAGAAWGGDLVQFSVSLI